MHRRPLLLACCAALLTTGVAVVLLSWGEWFSPQGRAPDAGVEGRETGRDGPAGSRAAGGDLTGAGGEAPRQGAGRGGEGRPAGPADSGARSPEAASASVPGGGPEDEAARVRPGALRAGSSTLLVLVTRGGAPLSGAAVGFTGGGGARSATTGPEGRAEAAAIAAGGYEIRVLAPPGSERLSLRTSRPVAVGEGETVEVRCELPDADATIEGRLLDPQGQPVPEIEVEARPLMFPGTGAAFVLDGEPPPAVRSSPDGSFRFAGLARLEHAVTTRETPRHPPARQTVLAGSGEPVDIVLGERRTVLIHGRVTDVDGLPVAGVQVAASSQPGRTSASDAEGEYALELQHERGAVLVTARKAGYAPREKLLSAALLAEQEEVEVDLEIEPLGEVGALSGRVTSQADGQPVPDLAIHLHSASLNAAHQGRTGEDGSYTVSEVRPAADYRLWITPQRGFHDFSEAPLSVSTGPNQLDIQLEPLETGRVSGRMLDPEGRALPRLTLWIRSHAATSQPLSVTGDDAGRFAAEGVPAGELSFETRASPWVSVRGLKLAGGEDRQVDLPIGLGQGRLAGTISFQGQPVPGARLTLSWSEVRGQLQSSVYREATSDAQGRFTFSGTTRGRATLSASVPGRRDHRETRELTGGADQVILEVKN